MPPTARQPYSGISRGLVMAMDFGTTFSGVSYAILDPGEIPMIQSVNGFEGQEDQSSSTKVPSVLLYDRRGDVRACGAEIHDSETIFEATEEEWTRVEWLKLLFRPNDQILLDVPETVLPPGKSAVKVLGDYLKYLRLAAERYIKTNEADGDTLWKGVEEEVVYVLSHPNGWDGSQQSQLRNAAIIGGLIPATDQGRTRVRFVTEGEASFHWCIEKGLAARALTVGAKFVVADAGGGTIDVSSFRVTATDPLQIEEMNPADCRLAGSVFITYGFKKLVTQKLEESAYGDEETIDRLVEEFDRKAKRIFRDPSRKTFIPFGTPRDHEPTFHIRSGQLMVSGSDMGDLFESSCLAVSDAVRDQTSPGDRTTVFLVGGFAASPWLYSELQRRLLDLDVVVKRAESHTAKAVAEGAIGFYLDHYVAARVARFTYGVSCATQFNRWSQDHIRRAHLVHRSISGRQRLSGHFDTLVAKGALNHETSIVRNSYTRECLSPSALHYSQKLTCYRGSNPSVSWLDDDPDNFREICTFTATIPPRCFQRRTGALGLEYWEVNFFIVVKFGTTEFTCHAEWMEDGELKEGPASVVWEES